MRRRRRRRRRRKHHSESDGESEGDGPEVPRGGRWRGRGRARGGARGRTRARSPASSGDEGWSEDPTPPVMHPHTARPGLTVPVPTSVLGFVQLFLTRELLEYFVDETNDYARYCRQELHITLSHKWHRCNLTDMAHYLGLLVFFGLLVCGDVRQYWHRGFFMATPNVAGLMTRDTFLSMDRYFHVFNRRAIPRGNQEKLILVRPLMEYLQDRCRMLVVPSKNLSLDEGLLAYKGRLSIKVYNPKKPKKYGVKFFFVTESTTGYVLDFSIYSGVFSTLRDTVFQLVDRFRGQGYHLFMDNYYNSVALAQELYDAGIHCSGTLRLVRGAPTVLKDVGQNPRLLPKGETLWRRKKDVFCILWNDVRLVPMITTSHEPIQEEVTQRRKRRQRGRVHYEEVQVQRPTVIGHYNQHMGGVDLFDQLIQYYPFARRSKRWTAKLNKYLLQLAFQNAYVLYLEYSTDRPKLSHSRFLEAAGDGLVNFNPDDWPSMTGPIPRAGDLPLEQRADRERTVNPPPARRRHQDPADSSEDEEMVDEPDVPRSPLLMPPPDTPAATSTPAPAPAPQDVPDPAEDVPAAAPDVPAAAPDAAPDVPAAAPDAALPVPDPPGDQRAATFRPSQQISDPVDRLHRGDHTLVNIAEAGGVAIQKRCRVCQKNGRRRDTRFMCKKCKVPLCRVDAECSRKYHSMAVYWSVSARGTERGATRRPQ